MKKIQAIIHYLFLSAVTVKAFNGVIEVLSGLFLLLFGKQVEYEVFALTNYEFTERHSDYIGRHLATLARDLSVSSDHFVAYYLLFHGIMNFVLVVTIYKKKLWAYPVAILLFSIFLAYQIVRLFYNHSIGLGVMSVVDLLMIILTWLEYKRIINEK